MKTNDFTMSDIAAIAITLAEHPEYETVLVDNIQMPRDVWIDQADRFLNGDPDAFQSLVASI